MEKQDTLGNILVVDDTPENLELLVALMETGGYTVRPTVNGALALASARNNPPDIILLDIMMPEMDGYEVCRQLKSDPTTCDIPVIFLSALDETVDKVKAFNVGGVDYITKPFHVEEVMVRIATQLEIQRLRRQDKLHIERLSRQIVEHNRTEGSLQMIHNILNIQKQQLTHIYDLFRDTLTQLGEAVQCDASKDELSNYLESAQAEFDILNAQTKQVQEIGSSLDGPPVESIITCKDCTTPLPTN
jgi:DNA-binding response OmpR family regulator